MTPEALTISVVSSSLSLDLRRAADDARAVGFDGLTLEPARLDESARTRSGQREVAHVISSRGLRLVALSVDLPPKSLIDRNLADRALGETLRAIELAAGVRAPLLTIDLGALPEVADRVDEPQPPTTLDGGVLILPSAADTARYGARTRGEPGRSAMPGDFSLATSFADELARSADRFGMKLALGSSLASLASLRELLRRVSLPLLGIELDPSSLLREQCSIDDAMDRFANRVMHVRGRDGVAGAAGRLREAVIGQGDVRWAELLASLHQSERVPPLTIDPRGLSDPRAAAIAGLRHLRTLVA